MVIALYIYDQNGHQFHTNPIPTLASSLDEDIEYRRLDVDNNFVIKLNRRYLNTGFICQNMFYKSLNYSDFIYCGAHYSLPIKTKLFKPTTI